MRCDPTLEDWKANAKAEGAVPTRPTRRPAALWTQGRIPTSAVPTRSDLRHPTLGRRAERPRAREPLPLTEQDSEQDVLSLVPFRSCPPWPLALSGTVEIEFWPALRKMHRSENERSFENFEALLRMGSLPTLLFPDTRTQTSIGGYYNYNNEANDREPACPQGPGRAVERCVERYV